jgi:hypothetical protein
VVTDSNLLAETVNVRLDSSPDAPVQMFRAKEVRVLKNGRNALNKKELDQLHSLEGN